MSYFNEFKRDGLLPNEISWLSTIDLISYCIDEVDRRVWQAGIAKLCPTRGTRTPFNQDLSEELILRPFLQNVYYPRPEDILSSGFVFYGTTSIYKTTGYLQNTVYI